MCDRVVSSINDTLTNFTKKKNFELHLVWG
jgi:hypothetical protein